MDTAVVNRQQPVRRSGSLRTRLLIIAIALSIVPVIIVGGASIWISSQGLQDLAFNELAAVVALKESQVNTWIKTIQTNLDLIASNTTNQRNINTILSGSASPELLSQMRDEFNINRENAGYFDELFILDRDGRIVVSTRDGQEGKIQATQRYFTEGLTRKFVSPPSYEVSLGTASILVAQPLTDENGQIQGVLAGRANLDELNVIMAERTGLGESGETYLASANFAVLTNLRLIEVQPGLTYIRSEGLVAAIENKTNGQASYPDYVQIPVLGAYRWLPDLQVALVAEQDEEEALAAATAELQLLIALMVVFSLLGAGIAFLVTQSIANPIVKLAAVAGQISQGNFEQQAEITSNDEIGTLSTAFNTMTARLREFIGTLEQRVEDRTRALAISGQISRRLSTIKEQDKLVASVVNELKTGFNYYHAHIYLFDEVSKSLVLAGGTGEAGRILLERGHSLPIGRGLVGRAAESKKSILVPETRKDVDWLPNPLLPDTQAEIAVPIIAGDQVLGVLDIQNDSPGSLDEQDANLISTIADQVAIALQNIRQIESTQKIANDLSVVASVGIATATTTNIDILLQQVVDLSKESFKLYHAHIYLLNDAKDTLVLTAGAGGVGRRMVSEKRTIPLDSERSLVARAARTQQGVVVNDVRTEPDFLPNPLLPDTRAEMAVPMMVAGNVIGVLDVQAETVGRFTEVDVNIKTTLASQVAVALQNARSFAQTRHQAERETALNALTQKIQGANSIESALKITARELGNLLGKKQTLVTLQAPSARVQAQTVEQAEAKPTQE